MENQTTTITILERTDIDAWPFAEMRANPNAWTPVSERVADELLNVMPPRYVPGGFYVTEESKWEDGEPWFTAVLRVGDSYYARDVKRSAARSGEALNELRTALAEVSR